MFGTVRPRPCALPSDDRQAWRDLYCGTCKGLHAYGTPARALTSWDAVLLGALVEAVQEQAGPCGTCRCPLNPLVHRSIVAPESVATRTGAAVQVLLADAWLEDHAADDLPAASWLRPWVPSDRAAAALEELGLDPAPFVRIGAAQAEVEAYAGVGPVAAARPTADLMRHLLRSLVDLPGAAVALQTASARRSLGAMGADLGRAIYLIDALDDLGRDAVSGAFNPCISEGTPAPDRVAEASAALREAVARLGEAVQAFPWTRNRALLEHVLLDRLPPRAERAVRAGEAGAAGAALAVPTSWWARLWAGVWRAAVTEEEEREGAERHRRRERRESRCGHCADGACECAICADCCIDCGPGDRGCIDICPCEGCGCDCDGGCCDGCCCDCGCG